MEQTYACANIRIPETIRKQPIEGHRQITANHSKAGAKYLLNTGITSQTYVITQTSKIN